MRWAAVLLLAGVLSAQEVPAPAVPAPVPTAAELEQLDLSRALADAGSSSIDFTRALEKHLSKYPQSAQRPAIEKALAKSALDNNDRARTLLYGERVLTAEPASTDLQLMDRVTRTLLDADDVETAKKALAYADRYLKAVEAMRNDPVKGHMTDAQWGEEVNRGLARALVLKARATGNTGDAQTAFTLSKSSWDTMPGAEPAWEVGKWLSKLNRESEAVEYLADGFAMEDTRATEADRARNRARLGEIYTKLHGSETGLGDYILAAYDRMAATRRERTARLRAIDPNTGATEILDFTLGPVTGETPLAMASLKGKVVVMDFWATWCGPCRVQHPMVENVRKRYGKDDNVIFLAVNSDEDRATVPQFLKELKWEDGRNFYESGLARLLTVSSIPTLLVLDRSGRIYSRMAGFIPERFEDMLVERIEEARTH